MNTHIRKFLNDEDGITALEYGILAAVVAGILTVTFKDGLTEVFTKIVTTLKDAVGPATTGTGTG